jgi:hypothetical protein
LSHQYSFSYLFGSSHTLSHIFCRPSQQFGPTAYSTHRPNFLCLSSTFKRQSSPLASLATAPLFVVPSASGTMELPRLFPLFPSEIDHTASPPLSRFHLP